MRVLIIMQGMVVDVVDGSYSRNGGYDVVCYEGDVTDEMIRQWKQENAE